MTEEGGGREGGSTAQHMVKDRITITNSSRATKKRTCGDAFKGKKRQKTDEHKKIWRGEIELLASRKFSFVTGGGRPPV